jgi:dUTP pyrophosphatase
VLADEGSDRSDDEAAAGGERPEPEIALAEDAATEPDAEVDDHPEWSAGAEPSRPAEPAIATTAGSTLDEPVEELNFSRLKENATLPTRAHDGDAGLDLYASEAARIGPGQRVSVGTGLAVAIPPGLAGLVLPRSGLALKHGVALVNSPGLIDSGYRGEVRVLLLNTDATSEFRIASGDRIAQLVLVPIATASPLEADELDSSIRGGGGFGSSGP